MKGNFFIWKQQFIRILLGLFLCLAINTFVMDIVKAKEKSDIVTTKETFEMIPFYWTAGIIGSVIGLTLAYVSWRKYRAEKKEKTKESDS